jgi:hypothetical protein
MKQYIQAVVIFLFGTMLWAKDPQYEASRYKYIGVFNAHKATQTLKSTMGLEDFRKVIRKEWQSGHDLVELKYGNGHWLGVFGKANPKSHQTYVVASRWSAIDEIIDNYWKEGYYITNIEHGLAQWVVFFEKNRGYTNQAYESRGKRDDFIAAVHARWKQGYDLIDFEYGEGHYTGIFAQHTPYRNQALSVRSTWYAASKMIASYWQKGYRINNIEYTLGRWMVLFSKTDNPVAQGFETADTVTHFTEKFTKRQKEGYSLIDMAEGW